MKKNQETLFSIQNEELKRERKYALLAMKITFVYFFIASISIPIFVAWKMFFNQPFIISYFFASIMDYVSYVVAFLGFTLLILNALRKLHFWVCYIAGGFNILFFLYNSLSTSSQINSISLILSLVVGILLLIAPYRVQTFLRSQEKNFLTEPKTENLEDIKSSNDSSDKKRIEIKKNTLFSIQDDSLREEREYSLWIMRVYFILFCVFFINIFYGILSLPTYTYQSSMYRSNIAPIICLIIFSILFILIARGLWKLKFWCYFILSSLAILLSIVSFWYFSRVPYINTAYILITGISLLIPAWRVRSFLKKQAKETSTQKIDDIDNAGIIPVISQSNNYEASNNYEVSEEVIENSPLEDSIERNPLFFQILVIFSTVVNLIFYIVMKLFSIMVGNILFILWLICLPIQAVFRYCEDIINRFKNK